MLNAMDNRLNMYGNLAEMIKHAAVDGITATQQ